MKKITARELKAAIDAGTDAQIIDVRTPDEFIGEHIAAAASRPLIHFDQEVASLDKSREVYALCRGGHRAEEFCRKLDALGYRTFCIEGGLNAWLKEDFPVVRAAKQVWSIERQVRFISGLLVFLGIVLALTVHSGFVYFSALVGVGMMYSAAANFCGMALLLARMPWNKQPLDKQSLDRQPQ